MKSLHSKLSGIAPFIFFPMLIIFRKRKKTAFACMFFIVATLSSCYLNFYRTNTRSSIDATTAAKLKSENRYFIVHFINSTNGLEQVYVQGDSLYGKVVSLPAEHAKYLYPVAANQKNKVKAIDKKNALMEVHLYTTAQFSTNDSVFTASLSSFNRADIYELNRGATTTNHILSTVGIVLTVGLLIGLIVAASSTPEPAPTSGDCNCPQVFMENNGVYSFTSGLYSGAVYSTLERMDYLPLKSVPADAKNISFKIANAKDEEQFINEVQLLRVDHATGVHVLADRHGDIFSYKEPRLPSTVSIAGNSEIKDLLQQTDGRYYSFNNASNKNGFSDVTLTFDKPANADGAKLIIHARNSYWGGLLHKEFVNLFGDGFEQWRQKQEKSDPKDLEKWQTDQALPLMVYIKTNIGWKFVDYFQLIGNTASRDMIMQIDTKEIAGNKIELKLETAYRFWDLDYAGIDYSADENFKKTLIEPQEAIGSNNTDERDILRSSDKQYVHLTGDESISFKYNIPLYADDNEASYFLVSGGYYHSLEKITGKTNYTELYKFKNKGAFDRFSREKYQQVQDVVAAFK